MGALRQEVDDKDQQVDKAKRLVKEVSQGSGRSVRGQGGQSGVRDLHRSFRVWSKGLHPAPRPGGRPGDFLVRVLLPPLSGISGLSV